MRGVIICSGVAPTILRVVISGRIFQRDWKMKARWYELVNSRDACGNLTPIPKERLILQLYDSYEALKGE